MSDLPPKHSKLVNFCLGAFSTMSATVFTNPFEVVKIRLQLQGELQANHTKHYHGILSSFYKIIKNEGILAIQKGLCPGLIYQFFMNGTRLGTFGYLQPILIQKDDQNFYFKNTLLATFSGCLGGMVGSPFFLIKTRLQSKSNSMVKIGHQHQYDGFIDAIIKIIKNDGILGLFKGTKAAAVRVAVGSSVQLPVYDEFKKLLKIHFPNEFKDGTITHFTASLLTGFFVTTAMNPFDVISTRIYNETTSKEKCQYKGIIDCGIKTIQTEGVKGLMKGWSAHYARLAPHTILTFVFWEKLKYLSNKYF